VNRRNKVIYVAGKYTGDIESNIKLAREYSIKIWEIGFTAFTPHLNSSHFDDDCNCTWKDYMIAYLEILSRCDAIFMLPGWEDSKGALMEYNFAKENNIEIFYKLEDLEKLDELSKKS
jgi:hypothetical protein